MSDSTVSDITDEELAEWERGHEQVKPHFATPGFCRRCSHFWPCPTSRLIAALQARREEVMRLREQYDEVCLTITEG